MSNNTANAIMAASISAAVAVAIYVTKSGWCLWALVFIPMTWGVRLR